MFYDHSLLLITGCMYLCDLTLTSTNGRPIEKERDHLNILRLSTIVGSNEIGSQLELNDDRLETKCSHSELHS